MKRSHYLSIAILLIITLLSLPSCRKNDESGKKSKTPMASQRGGTIVCGTISDMDSFNDCTANGIFTVQVLRRLYLRLMEEGPDFEKQPPTFHPLLAQSWEFSDDRKEVTFHLRKDVLWSDGIPVTAHDVRFTWQAQTSPEVAWSARSSKEFITDVQAVGNHTVRFKFSRAYAYQLIDINEGVILPKHAFEKVPFSEWRKHNFLKEHVTNGPFKIKRYEPQQSVELERNEDYFDRGKPYLDRIVFRIVPDQAALLMQFLSENIDVMEAIPPKDAKKVEEKSDLVLDVKSMPNYTYIGWNAENPLFKNPRVRRALTMAIDRQEIVDSFLYGFGEVSKSPIISTFWAHNKNIEPWPFDPAAAKRILEEEGWKDSDGDGWIDRNGTRFEFELTTNAGNKLREDVLVKVQYYLQRIGIKINPRLLEMPVFIDRNLNHQFDAYIGNWRVGTKVDLKQIFHSSAIPKRGYNVVSYSNSEVDDLIDRTRTMEDIMEQKPLWDRIQEIIHEDQPYTFLFESKRVNGFNRRIQGVNMGINDTYLNLHEWWIAEPKRKE
ncbi:MAG: peptide-binding protein [Acidobacteriota bacterium]